MVDAILAFCLNVGEARVWAPTMLLAATCGGGLAYLWLSQLLRIPGMKDALESVDIILRGKSAPARGADA